MYYTYSDNVKFLLQNKDAKNPSSKVTAFLTRTEHLEEKIDISVFVTMYYHVVITSYLLSCLNPRSHGH